MFRPKAKHCPGDLVIWNKSKKFGDEEDRLFHIHSVRYGACGNHPKKQYLYSGYLLEITEYKSEGLPQVPVFSTTITNVSEDNIKGLEHLALEK